MENDYDAYIRSAIKDLPATQEEFLQLKKQLSKRYGVAIPTNADLRGAYDTLVGKKKIKRSAAFEKILLSRRVRTQSGVAVVAVLTKAYPCPGKCIYCPGEKDMPKSYLSNEPAVMRAIDSDFDPYRQVQSRLRSLELNGHRTDKIELIVMGGTFSFLPKNYQKKFIYLCFKACNEYPKKETRNKKQETKVDLLKEQKKNETARHRIIGITLETRPDYVDEKEILNFRRLGCTRVELGVQSIFDDVLELNKRGHLVAETTRATKLLKDAGFKISYHMMPGLPGSTPARDFKMFRELFKNSDFQPDMLKIYPTVVLKNSVLHEIWKKQQDSTIHLTSADVKCIVKNIDRYKPLTNKGFEKLVVKIKNEAIPPYVRIARLVRDVPTSFIVAGPTVSNLRQIIIPRSNCPCIRCREVRGDYTMKENVILDRIDYVASDGKEIFLQYVSSASASKKLQRDKPDKKKLFALLRLRIPADNGKDHFIPALRNAAIIREVHTYGKMARLGSSESASPQHSGLGKKLMEEAEKIAKKEFGLSRIVVISGVGVRGYYRKAGYRLRSTYMIKNT